MELLLNLVWLASALPAIWLCCRDSDHARDRRRFDRIRPFLLLGCVLMVLFPVVSATDDLHAMRQEMEESPSKRMVKQSAGDKSLPGLSHPGVVPALIFPAAFPSSDDVCGRISATSFVLPLTARSIERASRAPPMSTPGEGIRFAA